ncbi:hypothetical protein QWY31_13975 [Cytophagales bacterium LB-30]|uniref:Sulfotransferase domain-containing protein n=1 Tax=Shiella aurantiaca TaxID=3058365 RepID=A0ABT8F898_9BACT|nr:hypothetical protein [Shiella aurantiaca]MDN4166613.1 hypothetical protein [Shiella aurantiaca]
MKLFLHIGTEKTGSSFLQTVSARNRDLLQKCKIFYPKAGNRERDMIQGRISPGNGYPIFKGIKDGKFNGVHKFLSNQLKFALVEGCDSVLISNENIVDLALQDEGISKLNNVILEAGYQSVQWLLIIRDPLDQAISLFKHRAKSGQFSSPEKWVEESYKTMNAIQNFYSIGKDISLDVVYRKYARDSSKMIKLFFNDWLNVYNMPIHANEVVNPSLSFSELFFLKTQFKIDPYLVPYYYSVFLNIHQDRKPNDIELDNLIKKAFSYRLQKYNPFIEELNAHMHDNEQIQFVNEVHHNIDLGHFNYNMVFSEEQILLLLLEQRKQYSLYRQSLNTFFAFRDFIKMALIKFLKS